jgi:hypothetical protein
MNRFFIQTLMAISLSTLSACSFGPDFTAPRGEVNNIDLIVAQQGITLFKTKSPPKDFMKSLPVLMFRRAGYSDGKPIFLDGLDDLNNSMISVNFDEAIDTDFYRNYYDSFFKKSFINVKNNDKYGVSVFLKKIKSVDCKYSVVKGIYNPGIQLICPVFFRNTFGLVWLSFSATNGNFKGTLEDLEERIKKMEPLFEHMVNNLEFVEPVTQKVPEGFSLEEQFKRMKNNPDWKL